MPKPLLRQLIEERAAGQPDHNFLTFGESAYSYAEMDQHANRVANLLRELGIKPHDRVVFFLPNSPDFIFCWFATIKLNVTMVPVNIQLKGESLRYILSHAEPQAVITTAALLPAIQALPGVLNANCRLVVLGEVQPAGQIFSYAGLFGQASPERPPDVPVHDEDTAIIMYTSGTTGLSKGVMIGRRAQTNHPLYYHPELIRTEPHQVAYTYLPLFHVTSMGVTMGSFVGGARLALDTEFNPFSFWERVRKANATVFPYLGAVLSMLYARPPRPDDADNPVTHTLGGAAPKEIWAAFEKRFGLRILETYGQTEWLAVWVRHPDPVSRIGAAGKAPDRAEVRIVDENDQPLPPNTPGQIIMKPAEPGLMMSGYYKNPELNDRVFKDSWYYTGDMGELDADGYLYFRGRLKDYIRRRGENISSFEIERVVNTHPAVLESAAVGVPSEYSEEEVMLCLVLKPGARLEAIELWRWCRERLPAFSVPRYIKFLAELPHTPTQRVRKFMLAEAGPEGAWDRKASTKLPDAGQSIPD